jgi:Rifampin ADP-ribosyl transferase
MLSDALFNHLVSVSQRFGNHLMSSVANVFSQSFFHGTRADLKPGDLIVVGHPSNFTDVKPLSWVYFSATLDAAIWGAELAAGEGRERIYVVEPTGPIVDDPNLTDKKFPGNPTLSYRSRDPLRVVAEVTNWQGHSPERLQQMKENVARAMADGADIID